MIYFVMSSICKHPPPPFFPPLDLFPKEFLHMSYLPLLRPIMVRYNSWTSEHAVKKKKKRFPLLDNESFFCIKHGRTNLSCSQDLGSGETIQTKPMYQTQVAICTMGCHKENTCPRCVDSSMFYL